MGTMMLTVSGVRPPKMVHVAKKAVTSMNNDSAVIVGKTNCAS